MSFQLPVYHAPDFSHLTGAPDARFCPRAEGRRRPCGLSQHVDVPRILQNWRQWTLAPESRMDCSVVLRSDGTLDVVENRRLRAGDRVVIGRTERGEDGIYLHASGFEPEKAASGDQFAFRQGAAVRRPYARDYDRLVELLRHEREHGHILLGHGPGLCLRRGRPRRHAEADRKRLLPRSARRQRPRHARPRGRAAAHRPSGRTSTRSSPSRTGTTTTSTC